MLGAVVTLLAGDANYQDKPTFRSSVEAVRVDVLATRDGEPASGLTADNFEVRDNGVTQHVVLLASGAAALTAGIVLDASASLTVERYRQLQRASGALVGQLHAGDRAGLLTFTHVIQIRQPLTGELSRLGTALLDRPAPGGTALVDATSVGISMADSAESRGLVIVFSDGMDTASWLTGDAVLEAARIANVVVYGVTPASAGAESSSGGDFLDSIARTTGGRVFELNPSDRIETLFARIIEEFRQRYVLTYTPRGVAGTGWHRLEVRVTRRGVALRVRPGYFVPPQ
jgi:VWFA-related protein